MKILRKIKSVPNLIRSSEFQDSIRKMKKSASTQILTEFTQLSVDDAKHLNRCIDEMGNNLNEIAQTGVDINDKKDYNKISYMSVIMNLIVRVFVGSSVHYMHDRIQNFFKHIPIHLHIH
tara:strand:+ start:11341 stop:11700 length:360 start_codon:yes stop_codon:yes gene_type:complete